MIPGDLAARLRMLTEASFFSGEPSVAPLARVKAISEQLPAFAPGQRIVAHLQTARPDNTYQARIAGREVTLALPQAANAGDTLELVVSHVTPRAVFATLAQPTASNGSSGTTASAPALSQTGRLISFLLTGQPAAQTAALNGGQPMLATAPQSPGDSALLANRLSTALEQSGLFYESHQTRWLAGKLDTAALMQEPQGRSSTPPAAPPVPPEGAEAPAATPRAASEGISTIPERLLPLVHQQLDAVATQNFIWQGQVWPGQTMEWEIEDPAAEGRSTDEPDENWTSTLRLTLPRLGGVEARLHLTPAGVAMRLIADSDTTRQALAAAETRLADALAAADVPLTGLVAELRRPP